MADQRARRWSAFRRNNIVTKRTFQTFALGYERSAQKLNEDDENHFVLDDTAM